RMSAVGSWMPNRRARPIALITAIFRALPRHGGPSSALANPLRLPGRNSWQKPSTGEADESTDGRDGDDAAQRPPDLFDRHPAVVPGAHDDHRRRGAIARDRARQGSSGVHPAAALAREFAMIPVRRLFVSAAAMLLTVPAAIAAWAAPTPTEQVRATLQKVFRILDDSELRGDLRRADRRAAIRKVAHELFDFAEITKRSLGPHWQQRTNAEREELVSLFGDLLERTYVSRSELDSGERLVSVRECRDT